MSDPIPTVALALQGGGSHGAFTWGVLDRLLQEVRADRLRFAAISGTSAGAFNPGAHGQRSGPGWPGSRPAQAGGLLAVHLAGRFSRRQPLLLWRTRTVRRQPRPVSGCHRAGGDRPCRFAIYQPFLLRRDRPLVEKAFSAEELAALNSAAEPRLFLTATDVTSNGRAIFTQPNISAASLRASACLPTDFEAVTIGGVPYWDGGISEIRR